MRQFDVYANPSASSARFAPFVIVLQSHHIELKSVVVAPLVNDKLATSIEIAVEVEGNQYVMALTELGSIPAAPLRTPVANLSEYEYEVRRALDRLFSGF